MTLTEWQGVRVFENMVLRRIYEPKRNEISGWRKLTVKSSVTCTLHKQQLELPSHGG
jgi:hypothetical protein